MAHILADAQIYEYTVVHDKIRIYIALGHRRFRMC